jgi:16S rRNA processing protein RimM
VARGRDQGSGIRDQKDPDPPRSPIPDPRALDWDNLVLVGRIARPHGLRGQVVVNPETDFVEDRFRVGALFWTRSARGDEQLTVASSRLQNGRPVVAFEGFSSIEEVERLAGLDLRIPEDELRPLESGVYYHHQLIGCVVDTVAGERVGDVVRVAGGAAGSLLEVDGPRGQVLIPLVTGICVEIDVEAKRIRIDPPEGLLDLNRGSARRGERREQ